MVNKEKEIIVRPKETLLGVHICGGASQFVCAFVDKFVCQGSLSAEVYVRKSQVCQIRPIQGGTYSPLQKGKEQVRKTLQHENQDDYFFRHINYDTWIIHFVRR